ncbi:MAG: glycosyltransferase [Candidatus Gastranaerophilales bacterium]|nr:glycosyltransferase [Candidatus Gastranaerophilales bacterium]
MQKEEINFILLACCTYKRPEQLKSLLFSIKDLKLPENNKVEILIIDNDKNESAKNIVAEAKNYIDLKINYFVEENAGLTNARNRLLNETINLGATHAFLFDDDEILEENSLLEHLKLYNQYEDDIISSGIAINSFDDNIPKYIQNNMIFKKKTTKKTGIIKSSCATDNVFIPVRLIRENDLKFSSEFNFSGGEDIDFTSKAFKLGYNIIQNSDSIVYEPVLGERATLKYIFKRAYFAGFCGTYAKFQKNKNILKQIIYLINLLIVLLFNLILLIPSLLFGLTGFFNVFTKTVKTIGKIAGTLQFKPIEFYKQK